MNKETVCMCLERLRYACLDPDSAVAVVAVIMDLMAEDPELVAWALAVLLTECDE